MADTAQQVTTLLYYLHRKQQPPFTILFWSSLQKIDFDNSKTSIERIQQLFMQLSQRNIDLAKIQAQQGGDNFLLAIASYIGDVIAVTTGEPITWYDFDEISQQIAQQNQLNQTQFHLTKEFGNSLVAKIGEVYCKPLNLLANMLADATVLPKFMAEMQQAVFAQAHVNLLDEPNTVAANYLAKIKTGKLLDKTIGFYDYLVDVTFDFSQESLMAIDNALAKIAKTENFSQADYARIISDADNQAFFYLLGFYIGATSSYIANVPTKWADYDEMVVMLGDSFINCIEQRYVQLMENHYRTPILVVTNRLFGIAPNFPNTVVEFARIIAEQNRGELHIFAKSELNSDANDEDLPTTWQTASQRAGQLLAKQLQRLIGHQPIKPILVQADNQGEQALSLSTMDNDTALDKLYRQLNEPVGMLYQVASFALYLNLPQGQVEGIALELRVNEPSLALQLILPYRYLNDPLSKDITNQPNQLIVYPLISNQPLEPQILAQVKQTCAIIYQFAQPAVLADFWQSSMVDSLNPMTLLANQPTQQAIVLTPQITFPLLPQASNTQAIPSALGLNLVLPTFDYQSINWRGYDLPKYILETPQQQREYLQVVIPDDLIGDELFSQAEHLQRLYRYGKVVWGVVVQADDALYNYDESIVDEESPSRVLTADILYDLSGQASVEQLQNAAQQLQSLKQLSHENLPADQAFYLTHQQDNRSRIFGLDFPKSLQKSEAQSYLKITSSWIWRRHLPNGILTTNVVPIIIEPDSANQPMNAKGRVMILPSRFWSQTLYQNWLDNTHETNLPQSGDLMPKISWQEQQGYRYVGKGLDARLFPKFKFDAKPKSTAKIEVKDTTKPTVVTQPIVQKEVISTTRLNSITPQSVASSITDKASIQANPPVVDTPAVNNTSNILTPELQQQLLRDQARLQAELSTNDAIKDRKIYMMVGMGVAFLILMIIIATVLKK